MRKPLVLGIETSCDDTACALVDGEGRVLSSVVSSQLAAHRPYGGVVPEIASREHLANWPAVSAEALERAGVTLHDVDLVAATRGPGLVGALLVGLSLGKAIAFALDRPFHAVHHLEGHLYSPFLPPVAADVSAAPAEAPPERFVGLVLSGG
ncbi:MAG TPA: tRNA (adenosine(37)-N6)-threonylcarbamoyltransferase complex transferase subunit TsaD, partial [Thermoanaerobaculia bacterium]